MNAWIPMPRSARGVTLVELMIALLIGTILVLGLIQVFTASRSAYQLSEGLARTQENGRFALDYLQRDLRMAGHFGCVNDQAHYMLPTPGLDTTFPTASTPSALNFPVSIQGYEASGTQPGGAALSLAETPASGGAATQWSPQLPADVATATANRINGSDIVALRFLSPMGVPVTDVAGTPAEPVFSFDASRWEVLRNGVDNPGLFGVADCQNAVVFEAAAGTNGAAGTIAGGSAPNNAKQFDKVFTPGHTVLYRAESVLYYVGLNGSNRPSLYRVRFTAAPGGALASSREELIEGVENMQLLYGQDRVVNPALSPSGYMGTLGTASTIEGSWSPSADAWRRVGSVQVGLVLVSPDRAAAAQASVAPLDSLGVPFTAAADGRYRTVYQTTVALRNRLYGN